MNKEIFDGRWALICTQEKKYLLENVYNGNQVLISHKQLVNIRNGKDTISHIISRRIDNRTPYVTNNVNKFYREAKLRQMRIRAK